VRVGLHEPARSRAGAAQAVKVEIDPDSAGRQETSIATAEVEEPAVGQRRDPRRRPLDRVEIR
jgi:hypothetical protein